jgi:uncharacterized membrane protein
VGKDTDAKHLKQKSFKSTMAKAKPVVKAKHHKKNGSAVIGFGLSIFGVLTFWIPIIGTIVALAAMMFSKIGLSRAKVAGGSFFAVIGFILSILDLIASLAAFGVVAILFLSGYFVGKWF